MSLNSSKTPLSLRHLGGRVPKTPKPRHDMPPLRRLGYVAGLPVWVFLSFMLAQAIVYAAVAVLQALGVSFASVNVIIFNTIGGAIIYALAILIVIGVPRMVKKRITSREELGLHRLPTWIDLLWAPAGMVVYLILTSYVTQLAEHVLTFVDYSQAQQTGFSQLGTQPEYALAFISLVLIAPFAEEILFRGYLLGKLRKYAPVWVSILITSALFGFVHFQWNVGIDVFVLSIVLCLLRIYTGSLWPSIFLHMIKNGIAFYFLFINPALLSTMGG